MSNQTSAARQPTSDWGDIPQRLLTVSIGIPLVFLAIYLGGLAVTVLLLGVTVVAGLELQRMVAPDHPPFVPIFLMSGAVSAASIGVLGYFALLCLVLLIALVVFRFITQPNTTYGGIAALTLGSLYIGLPLATLVDVRQMDGSLGWLYVLIVTNWLTDSFALIGGRTFGRTKVLPAVSPSKTWEGVFSGVIAGSVGGTLLAGAFGLPLLQALVLSIFVTCFTVIGDLLQSAFKRYYHLKDSGRILPGHGGLLDRIDGLILASIPFYAMMLVI